MAQKTNQKEAAAGAASPSRVVGVFRTVAVVSLLALVYQFATAGQILVETQSAELLHWLGSFAVHAVFGLLALAAAAHWWLRRVTVWPTVVAVLVFALSFLQAYFGHAGALGVHVPLALGLTVGTVWVAAWSFTLGARQ